MSADLEKLFNSMDDGMADAGNQALEDCLSKSKSIGDDTKNKSGQPNRKVVKANNLKRDTTKRAAMK